MDPQTRQQLLKKRATLLAAPILLAKVESDATELLVFKLAEEEYGIETKYFKEVYPLLDYTPLPSAPAFVMGLVNLRRKIVVVIDLKVVLSLEAASSDEKRKLIVLQDARKEFAVVTDGISGIQHVPVGSIQPALPTLTGVKLEFILGITNDRVVILNGEKLLSSKHLVVDETVEV